MHWLYHGKGDKTKGQHAPKASCLDFLTQLPETFPAFPLPISVFRVMGEQAERGFNIRLGGNFRQDTKARTSRSSFCVNGSSSSK